MEDDRYEPDPLPLHDLARSRRAGESLDDYIRRVWPEVLDAVKDVDRTLFQATLALSPIDRLEQVTQAAFELEALRNAFRAAHG